MPGIQRSGWCGEMSPGLSRLEFWSWFFVDLPFIWKISRFSCLEAKSWPKSLAFSLGCPWVIWGTLRMPDAQAMLHWNKIIVSGAGGRHQWFLILSRWFQSRLPAAGLRTSQSFTSEDFLSPWHKPNVSSVPISYSDKLTSHCLLRTLSPISPPRKELLLFLRGDHWHGLHTFSSSSSLWLSCPLRDWPRPRVGRRSSRRGASNEATYLLLLSYLRERCRVEVVEEMMFWHHPWIPTVHPILTPSKAISTLSLCW